MGQLPVGATPTGAMACFYLLPITCKNATLLRTSDSWNTAATPVGSLHGGDEGTDWYTYVVSRKMKAGESCIACRGVRNTRENAV